MHICHSDLAANLEGSVQKTCPPCPGTMYLIDSVNIATAAMIQCVPEFIYSLNLATAHYIGVTVSLIL